VCLLVQEEATQVALQARLAAAAKARHAASTDSTAEEGEAGKEDPSAPKLTSEDDPKEGAARDKELPVSEVKRRLRSLGEVVT
jgi:hypothetical protein